MKRKFTFLLFMLLVATSYSQNGFWGLEYGQTKEEVLKIINNKGYNEYIVENKIII